MWGGTAVARRETPYFPEATRLFFLAPHDFTNELSGQLTQPYREHVWVYGCVNAISQSISAVLLLLKTDPHTTTAAPRHPVATAPRRRPAPRPRRLHPHPTRDTLAHGGGPAPDPAPGFGIPRSRNRKRGTGVPASRFNIFAPEIFKKIFGDEIRMALFAAWQSWVI